MRVTATLWFYSVGYQGWETHEETILCHPEHMSRRKFRALCESIIQACTGDGYFFRDIVDDLAAHLCEHHGFTRVEYSGSFVEDENRVVGNRDDDSGRREGTA